MVEMVNTKPLCDMGWWEVRDRREGSARGSLAEMVCEKLR